MDALIRREHQSTIAPKGIFSELDPKNCQGKQQGEVLAEVRNRRQ
jgi:hypothetical protein